jgi:hypothetical protein
MAKEVTLHDIPNIVAQAIVVVIIYIVVMM